MTKEEKIDLSCQTVLTIDQVSILADNGLDSPQIKRFAEIMERGKIIFFDAYMLLLIKDKP